MLNRHKQNAFTLIELGVIIAIIGVMSAVAVTQMMDLTGNAEAAVLEDYLQKLNSGSAQFLAYKGRRPTGFGEFMAATNADLDPDTGLVVPLLYSKSGDEMCGTTAPGDDAETLTCDGEGLANRRAVYTLDNGMVTMVLTNVD